MKLTIQEYLKKKFPYKKILSDQSDENQKWFVDNQMVDAINGYSNIKKYLNKKNKILEIGGGMHFLSNYLAYLNYDIISLEPGGFRSEVDEVRRRILKLKEPNLNIKNVYLENIAIKYQNKFDFVYSINVLEHTKDLKKHLFSINEILRNEMSVCHIRCPNYTFPFESHFYKFFIPFFPKYTFNIIHKKKLIKLHGKKLYYSTLKSINFKCTYFNIKRLNLNVKFLNPFEDIFSRISKDKVFKERILSNKIIYQIYFIIKLTYSQKVLSILFPKFLFPYLIINLKKLKS